MASIIYTKYKPLYKVTLNGQVIGYIEDKENMKKMVEHYKNDIYDNIAYITLNCQPNYELQFASGKVKDDTEKVLSAIKNNSIVTYRTYAINQNGKEKIRVNTEAEAMEIVNSVNEIDRKKVTITEIYSAEHIAKENEISKEVAVSKLTTKVKKQKTKRKKTTHRSLTARVNKEENIKKITKQKTKRVTVKKFKVKKEKKVTKKEEEEEKIEDTPSVSSNKFAFPVRGCSLKNIKSKKFPSYSGHTGIDININVKGKSVVAADDGVVIKSKAIKSKGGSYRSYGECIIIRHNDGKVTLYAHMKKDSRVVFVGDKVHKGQVIGKVGSTGNSSGTHLHFEVKIKGRAVNPFKYL